MISDPQSIDHRLQSVFVHVERLQAIDVHVNGTLIVLMDDIIR